VRLALVLLLFGCGQPRVTLVEGYCPGNEAPRCYFEHLPEDGF